MNLPIESARDEALEERLTELVPLLDNAVHTELEAIALAIAVEDSFDIVLSDDEISPSRLRSVDSIRALIQEHGQDS